MFGLLSTCIRLWEVDKYHTNQSKIITNVVLNSLFCLFDCFSFENTVDTRSWNNISVFYSLKMLLDVNIKNIDITITQIYEGPLISPLNPGLSLDSIFLHG